jgi:hypothetical protein
MANAQDQKLSSGKANEKSNLIIAVPRKTVGQIVTESDAEKSRQQLLKEDKEYDDWKVTPEAQLIRDHLWYAFFMPAFNALTRRRICVRQQNV